MSTNQRNFDAHRTARKCKKEWSEKDLVNKWGRKLPAQVKGDLPWDVLSLLVASLSDDTKMPRDVLTECIRTRDIPGLFKVTKSLDVTGYTSADLLLQDRLVAELFSKFDFPDSPFNKKEKAQLRFFEAEQLCRETNFRVSRSIGLTTDVNAVIHSMIRDIDRILGVFDTDRMIEYSRFGPGASLCVTGPFTTEYYKLCEKTPTVSSDAFPYAEALMSYDLKWKAHLLGVHPFDVAGPFEASNGLGVEFRLSDHNKVAFVPKNAMTLRAIAIEPYFNVYFQLGVGGMIRNRLFRRCGINLDSQLRNQTLAHYGSITGRLATIDFSMASDTIAREVVRLLISRDWFSHLDRLRSKFYVMQGRKTPELYEKFSSMGNGFTFELETLIFYAAAKACCEFLGVSHEDVSVFGDDVILPVEATELFYKVTSYLGFRINEEKSFSTGNFRESCGSDFLKGFDVRPVFCKELETVQHVASLANRLSALNRAVGSGSRVNDMLYRTVDLLHSRIPRDVRRFVVGPPTEDFDGYIHAECVSRIADSPLVRWNRDLFCWEFPSIRFRAKSRERSNASAALWVNWGTAVRRTPIPKPRQIVEGLKTLPGYHTDLSDFVTETTERLITGRKIGSLSMGTTLAWSLGKDISFN